MAVEKKIERELAITLTPEQKHESGRKCAMKELELRDLDNTAKEAAAEYSKKKKALRAEIKTLALEATSGERTSLVECLEITNWPNGVQVVRLDRKPGDADYVIEERPCDVNEVKKDEEKPEEEKKKAEKKGKATAAARTLPMPGVDAPADAAAAPAVAGEAPVDGAPAAEVPAVHEVPAVPEVPATPAEDGAAPTVSEEPDPADAAAAPAEAAPPPAEGSAPAKPRRRHLTAVN